MHMYEHERQVQIHKNEGFTVLSNGFIRDKNLSNRALGLLTFMLSLPPNWDYSIAGLTKVRKEGYEAIKNTIKELIDLNYIRRDKIRLSNGRFKHIYHIYDEPVANELKIDFLPEGTFPGVVEPSVVNQQEINKEEISKNNKDKHENIDKPFLRHKPLINELIRLEYIKDDDEQLIFYDSLFSKLVDNGMNYVDIYSAIHYVVPKVITRNFIDEDGKEIKNKFGYLKTSIESNIRKLNSLNEDLYPDDPNDKFWDNYEL